MKNPVRTSGIAVSVVLFLASCGSQQVGSTATSLAEPPPSVAEPEESNPVTEEDVQESRESAASDDVAITVTAADEIVAAGATSTLTANIFGTINGGDGRVVEPTLVAVADPGITFTDVPVGCIIDGSTVTCVSSEMLYFTNESVTQTASLELVLNYQVDPGAVGPLSINLEATSYDNPVTNDPDPTNNTTTITIQTS